MQFHTVIRLYLAGTISGLFLTPAMAQTSFIQANGAGWVTAIGEDSLPNPFQLRSEGRRLPIQLAHAILVKAYPDRESVITDVPEEVLLVFNEGVGQEFLALAVVDETGKRVDKHDVRQDFTDRSHVRASVDKLTPGRYMVRYRVLSADGHVVSGKYFFRVQAK